MVKAARRQNLTNPGNAFTVSIKTMRATSQIPVEIATINVVIQRSKYTLAKVPSIDESQNS